MNWLKKKKSYYFLDITRLDPLKYPTYPFTYCPWVEGHPGAYLSYDVAPWGLAVGPSGTPWVSPVTEMKAVPETQEYTTEIPIFRRVQPTVFRPFLEEVKPKYYPSFVQEYEMRYIRPEDVWVFAR